MRFFNRAMTGLVLFGVTMAFLASAVLIVVQSRTGENAGGFGGAGGQERVFTVTVIPIEPQEVTPVLTAFGEVVSGRTLELRSASSGALVELSDNFVEGGTVMAGDLLFQTDPAAAQADLEVSATELEEAKAEQSEANEALSIAEDELSAAQRQLDLRVQALERQKNLRERGVGTEAALETAELAVSSAETTMLGKRQSLANAKARINTAKINLSRKDIAFREAERMLADRSVYAEFDGVLSNVKAVRGGLVSANEKLGDLIDPSALEVAFQVSTQQYTNLLKGAGNLSSAKTEIEFLGLDEGIPATITRSSAAVGEGLTGRQIFARIDGNGGTALRAGDFVTVHVTEEPLRFATQIPATAANAAGEVLVLGEDNRLELAKVEILRKQGDDIVIRPAGIVGEKIVKRRIPQIGAGIKVDPRDDVAPTLQAEEMVTLTDEEKEKFTAGITAAPIPDDRKKRILERIANGELPKSSYERMKARMGG